jgi:hypothetical protein
MADGDPMIERAVAVESNPRGELEALLYHEWVQPALEHAVPTAVAELIGSYLTHGIAIEDGTAVVAMEDTKPTA